MLEITRIDTLSDLRNQVLHARAKRGHVGRSLEFIAVINGLEHGLLSYEDWSEDSIGFIYEIFVLPSFRKQGIGSALLSYAEDLAIQLGCKYIQLKPHALDHETDQKLLDSWYIGKGYIQKSSDKELMEKILL